MSLCLKFRSVYIAVKTYYCPLYHIFITQILQYFMLVNQKPKIIFTYVMPAGYA